MNSAPLVVCGQTPDDVAAMAADMTVRTVWAARAKRPERPVHVAISGGTTPYAMLSLLRAADLPWSLVHWYWVDERFVEHDHERSNVGAARRALFDHVPAAVVCAPKTPTHATLAGASEDYEARLRASLPGGDFDLVILGMGDDGHTASLFPGEPEVAERARWVVPVPARRGREDRLSLTMPMLENAHTTLLLAQGASKASMFRKALEPASLSEVPARIVQNTRNRAICIVDRSVVG